jgi:hypothetical protein
VEARPSPAPGRPRSLSPSGEAEQPPPARPPPPAGSPPAGARERRRHRPAQAQALRRAERSGVHPGPANRRGGGGPTIFGRSSILWAGVPEPQIGLGPRPWRARPARVPGTLPCKAGPGWGPGYGRGTAPTAGPRARARRGSGGGAAGAGGRRRRPGPGPPLLLPGSPQRRVQPGACGRFPLRGEDRGRLLL